MLTDLESNRADILFMATLPRLLPAPGIEKAWGKLHMPSLGMFFYSSRHGVPSLVLCTAKLLSPETRGPRRAYFPVGIDKEIHSRLGSQNPGFGASCCRSIDIK